MTQHNLTQILKVIRDLVMRNRPCYRDYLGKETVTKTVQIGAGTWEDNERNCEFGTPVTDSSFKGFVLGETYTVILDGVSADYVAREIPIISEEFGVVIGTVTALDEENNTYDGWLVGYNPTDNICFGMTLDMSFAGKTISISQTKTETVKRYKTKLLPEYLLPAFLRKNVVASKAEVQSAAAKATAAADTANTAQSTADNAWRKAQGAEATAASANGAASNAAKKAETAQTTADEAKTTAVAAKNAADNVSNAVTPSRGPNSRCQYSMVNVYDASAPVDFYMGRRGYGMLEINVDGTTPAIKITPPVSGANQADFEIKRINTGFPHPKIKGIGGIVMHSSTSGSDKQFLITVDDTGTLTAKEVTS